MQDKTKQKMHNKFLQIIRQAFYSVVSSDTSEYPQAQVTSNGKATNITKLSTYGVCANPPKGSHVLMFQNQGQESTKFGIFNDFINRKRGLKEGEVALFNTLTGAMVFMKADGSIAIESDLAVDVQAPMVNVVASVSVNIEAPLITLKGAVIVDGSITGVGGTPLPTPDGVDFPHVHSGVTTGGSNTGGVV